MPGNPIVQLELTADQPEALTTFYREMFGWSFRPIPEAAVEYWHSDADGPRICVGVVKRQHPQHVAANYVGTADIDATIAKATRLGATVVLPKMPIPGGRAIAMLVDPQGNLFGLLQTSPEERPGHDAGHGG